MGTSWVVHNTRGSCSSCKTRPRTPLSDTLSLANSTKTTSQGYGQGATSPRCLLVKLQAQLLPFPTSLFRLKSFCYPIKKVIKTITTSIKCSQQMNQLVLHSSWLPAARCHGWTGAASSMLGSGWTSIWERWGGSRGKDWEGFQLPPWLCHPLSTQLAGRELHGCCGGRRAHGLPLLNHKTNYPCGN